MILPPDSANGDHRIKPTVLDHAEWRSKLRWAAESLAPFKQFGEGFRSSRQRAERRGRVEPFDQRFRVLRLIESDSDLGEKVDDAAEVEDVARVAFELAEVGELGDERLGDVFVFADFLFIHGEHLAIILTGGAGERHGLEMKACQRNEQLRSGPGKTLRALRPTVGAKGSRLANHRSDQAGGWWRCGGA